VSSPVVVPGIKKKPPLTQSKELVWAMAIVPNIITIKRAVILILVVSGSLS